MNDECGMTHIHHCSFITHHFRPAFTLVETLMAAAILAATVAAVVAPISASYMQIEMAQDASIAASLARQLLDEITSKPYVDPTDWSTSLGPEPDETSRALFDNVDDYHGYADSTSALRELDGTDVKLSSSQNFQRSVRVEYRASPQGPAAQSGDYAMVTVTVTGPGGQSVTASRLVCKYPRLMPGGAVWQ